jgi:hypothetical protein
MSVKNLTKFITKIALLVLCCTSASKHSTQCTASCITGMHIQALEVVKKPAVTLRITHKAILLIATHRSQHRNVITTHRMVIWATPEGHSK